MDSSPVFHDRAAGAFLGLAVGDAFGRPLEFLTGPEVRARPVRIEPGEFDWTDDTHMSLYLSEAVLAQPSGPLDEDRFGDAVGEAFSRWLDDPFTPASAPGNTCLAGAHAWRRSRDWRTSGVPRSDGCGAVMRIAPIGIGFAGDDLDRAARIQARVTHGNPDASEAAVAAARLLRLHLLRGSTDPDLVRAVIAGLDPDGLAAAALRAALAWGPGPEEAWLDDRAIPPHDGGWRSASAIGLAVAAALRWGPDGARVVERAARIDGDSDSVAALAGMLVGAAFGPGAFPAAWLEAVRERPRIERLARALAARGAP